MTKNFVPTITAALATYATLPSHSRGRLIQEEESPLRTIYQRDRDRIVHSAAFRRLEYKTQVFVNHEGDHYRTRLTHTIEVAQIARSISRVLGLCEELAEALALAHDLGHPPFGHAGEDALNESMQPFGGFDHNAQTIKILTKLEWRYAAFDGLNLTWETLEGIAKHNGPLVGPHATRTAPAFILDFDANYSLALDSFPSAEAQVASLADDIAYHNHDLEDGLRAGLFTVSHLSDVPVVGPVFQQVKQLYPGTPQQRLIHESIRRLINLMVADLITQTERNIEACGIKTAEDIRHAGQAIVAFSPEMEAHNKTIKAFLMERMYRHYKVNRMTSKAKRVVQDLFALLHREPECLPTEWRERAQGKSSYDQAHIVADYIAGMTDRYAWREHQQLFEMDQK